MFRATEVRIDLSALRHNLKILRRSLASQHWICPMVKANAYGHGAVPVARAFEKEKVNALGVALVDEGLELREAGIRLPILVFGHFSDESLEAIQDAQLTPVIGRLRDLIQLAKIARRPQHFHLKINTGMNRLGLDPGEWSKAMEIAGSNPHLKLEALCSHLVQGEEKTLVQNQIEQLRRAQNVISTDVPVHLWNSAAILAGHAEVSMGARPGIAVYGAGQELNGPRLDLRPVMTFRTEIAQIHKVEVGQGVSYNWRWKASKPSTIAVLPCGYADGIPRILTGRAQALLRGIRVPLVGTICMDYIMLDVTDVDRPDRPILSGEEVILWGEQEGQLLSTDEVAAWAETISYELMTGVGSRVPRRYLGGD